MEEKNWTSTSTADVQDQEPENGEKNWTIDDIYGSYFSTDELIGVLDVISRFRKKYPNEVSFDVFEEVVRDEICNMFGGSIYN